MKVCNNINEFQRRTHAVLTIGMFDGVHLGHRKIIDQVQKLAEQTKAETVVLTFFPHPRMILHPEDAGIKLLSTMAEKAALLQELGVDHLIVMPFTRDLASLSPQTYIKNILIDKIGMTHIVIGYDHRFAKNRQGGLNSLQEMAPVYGFEVEEIAKQDVDDVAVNSTTIRHALFNGDVRTAHQLLGYPFRLIGKVIQGDRIGRTIGFPTANILIEENYKLIPADGIYAVTVDFPKKTQKTSITLKGMGYIGYRPTVSGRTRNIEVYIFDFDEDIYGQLISINFIDTAREDQKFNSLEDLRVQLIEDERAVKNLLEKSSYLKNSSLNS